MATRRSKKASTQKKTSKPPALALANVRRPFEMKTLSSSDAKQLRVVLKLEGTTIEEARDGHEPINIEVVDVAAAKKPLYQLWLWSFGSGALFTAGTTKIVATIAQHGFDMANEDSELRTALAAAWKAGAKKLRIEESVDFTPPETIAGRAKASSSTELPDLASLPEKVKHGSPAYDGAVEVVRAWDKKLFGTDSKWRVYPKLAPRDVNDQQRLLIEKAVRLQVDIGAEQRGLFQRDEDNLRFIGKQRPGPSDVDVRIGKDPLPLWCAVSRVGSGHMKHADVLAAFKALPATDALAAWTEIASGKAYDVHEARGTSMKESDIPRTKLKMAHSQRIFEWMADASLALGDAGHKAAVKVLDALPEYYFSPQLFIAALALVRHAKQHGRAFPPSVDALLPRLRDSQYNATAYCTPVRDEIFAFRKIAREG